MISYSYILSKVKYFIVDYNLACIDMYCDRLHERTYAKQVVHDYQLMDKYFFSKDKPKRRLTLEEKFVEHILQSLI